MTVVEILFPCLGMLDRFQVCETNTLFFLTKLSIAQFKSHQLCRKMISLISLSLMDAMFWSNLAGESVQATQLLRKFCPGNVQCSYSRESQR